MSTRPLPCSPRRRSSAASFRTRILLAASSLCLVAAGALGARNDWAEGSAGGQDGATRDYYNRAGFLPWKHFMGDWRDARNESQGAEAYATARVADEDRGRVIEWDVTGLVREWLDGRYPHQGFFLRAAPGGGTIVFCSREHAVRSRRPRLVITGEDGVVEIAPQADTYLTRSTFRSQGRSDVLRVSGAPDHTLLRFDLQAVRKRGKLLRASLRLYTTAQYGAAEIGVFRCRQGHDLPPSDPVPGLAARYPGDEGIASDPDVVFATGFESGTWYEEWTHAGKMDVIDTVSRDAARHFEPLQGKALRVKIEADGLEPALKHAGAHRAEHMWPWEETPKSVAHGILDDETYDWFGCVRAMAYSGGLAPVVSEETLIEARRLIQEEAGIHASATGAASLAGLLRLTAAGLIKDGERVCCLITGRASPKG